jgi:hypothetical protein
MANKEKYKKIAMGVLAAAVGATAFGAVHYYFLSGMTGNLYGVPFSTVLPIVAGTLGLVGAYMFAKEGIIHDVIIAGSAASIGMGILSYAGWVTLNAKAPAAGARAAATYVPPRVFAPQAALPMAANAGTKMI